MPSELTNLFITLLGVAALSTLVWLTLAIRRWWKARILHARMDVAADGERRAEVWLAAQGYRVLERQATRRCQMFINGRVAEYDLRADLLVQKGEELMIVEVKTGEAADPRLPATRRQLREYAAVFDVPRIYVFDAVAERLHEVQFPE